MSTKGLCSIMFAPLSDTDDTKYTAEPSKFAAAIESKPSMDISDTKVYADNVPQECDNSVTGGKLVLTVYNEDVKIVNPLLGKTSKTTTIGEEQVVVWESNGNDKAKYIGIGYIETTAKGYKATMYKKVQLNPYETNSKTKEDKVSYNHSDIEGTIFLISDGSYKKEAICETKEAAIEALKSFFPQAAA